MLLRTLEDGQHAVAASMALNERRNKKARQVLYGEEEDGPSREFWKVARARGVQGASECGTSQGTAAWGGPSRPRGNMSAFVSSMTSAIQERDCRNAVRPLALPGRHALLYG